MICRLILMMLGAWVCFSANATSTEHVLWEKVPISIQLPIGEERMIRFPAPISIVDSELDEDMGIMKLEDALYLNANKSFKGKRLVVQLMPEGEAIVLKFSANESYRSVVPVEVLLPNADEDAKDSLSQRSQSAITHQASSPVNPVSLTRFAIQSLYAPARLLVMLDGVTRTPMQTKKYVPLVYGASVSAHPLISWTADGLYVTAVELKNDLNKKIILDPRSLQGSWETATFYPTNTLNPRNFHETTTVFLVSSRPFGEALAVSEGYVR